MNEDRGWQQHFVLSKEEYELGKKILGAYLYTLTFLPGTLSIFYGDEIGMQGMGNLCNRRAFNLKKKDQEILDLFRRICNIRNQELFLEQADLDIVDLNERYFAFRRFTNKEETLIFVNRTDHKEKIILPESYQNEDILYCLKESNKNELDAYGGITLKKIKK